MSRTSFRRVSDEHRLSREKALQAELEHWQLAWKDEKKRNDKLIADMASREKEWSRREEKCRLEYESQVHELKQELFVMQSKLNESEKEADVRKRVAAGGNLEVSVRFCVGHYSKFSSLRSTIKEAQRAKAVEKALALPQKHTNNV